MKRLNTKMVAGGAICCMMIVLSGSHATGATQAGSASASPASNGTSNSRSATAKSSKTAAANGASESDIAAAKASGKVWVNTDTGIYHESGRWYGKTKSGKFMTESEAKAAGYKAGKN